MKKTVILVLVLCIILVGCSKGTKTAQPVDYKDVKQPNIARPITKVININVVDTRQKLGGLNDFNIAMFYDELKGLQSKGSYNGKDLKDKLSTNPSETLSLLRYDYIDGLTGNIRNDMGILRDQFLGLDKRDLTHEELATVQKIGDDFKNIYDTHRNAEDWLLSRLLSESFLNTTEKQYQQGKAEAEGKLMKWTGEQKSSEAAQGLDDSKKRALNARTNLFTTSAVAEEISYMKIVATEASTGKVLYEKNLYDGKAPTVAEIYDLSHLSDTKPEDKTPSNFGIPSLPDLNEDTTHKKIEAEKENTKAEQKSFTAEWLTRIAQKNGIKDGQKIWENRNDAIEVSLRYADTTIEFADSKEKFFDGFTEADSKSRVAGMTKGMLGYLNVKEMPKSMGELAGQVAIKRVSNARLFSPIYGEAEGEKLADSFSEIFTLEPRSALVAYMMFERNLMEATNNVLDETMNKIYGDGTITDAEQSYFGMTKSHAYEMADVSSQMANSYFEGVKRGDSPEALSSDLANNMERMNTVAAETTNGKALMSEGKMSKYTTYNTAVAYHDKVIQKEAKDLKKKEEMDKPKVGTPIPTSTPDNSQHNEEGSKTTWTDVSNTFDRVWTTYLDNLWNKK